MTTPADAVATVAARTEEQAAWTEIRAEEDPDDDAQAIIASTLTLIALTLRRVEDELRRQE